MAPRYYDIWKKEVFSVTENLSTVQQPPCGYYNYNWPPELWRGEVGKSLLELN
jgi:hypothetical protein